MAAKDVIWWSSQLLWLFVSIVLLVRLGVFSPRSLAAAPARRSNLSLLAVAAVVLLYLGTVVFTQVAFGVFYRPASPTPPAATAAATLPATASAPATAPGASEPATAPTLPLEDPHAAMVLQLADALTKIIPTLVILALVRHLVVGGVDAWGLSLRKIPAGIGYGLLGFLIIYPILLALNVIVSLLIEHFQRRPEETHETLQLLGRHDISSWERVTFVLTAGLFAPVLEEIFFRGLLQTVFTDKHWGFLPRENRNPLPPEQTPPPPHAPSFAQDRTLSYQSPPLPLEYDRQFVKQRWLAILAASFIFAAIHLMPDSFVVLFVLAIALGYLYERTGNLWACITLHAAFNGLNIYLYTRS